MNNPGVSFSFPLFPLFLFCPSPHFPPSKQKSLAMVVNQKRKKDLSNNSVIFFQESLTKKKEEKKKGRIKGEKHCTCKQKNKQKIMAEILY